MLEPLSKFSFELWSHLRRAKNILEPNGQLPRLLGQVVSSRNLIGISLLIDGNEITLGQCGINFNHPPWRSFVSLLTKTVSIFQLCSVSEGNAQSELLCHQNNYYSIEATGTGIERTANAIGHPPPTRYSKIVARFFQGSLIRIIVV